MVGAHVACIFREGGVGGTMLPSPTLACVARCGEGSGEGWPPPPQHSCPRACAREASGARGLGGRSGGRAPPPHTSVCSTMQGGVWGGGGAAAPPQHSYARASARSERSSRLGWGKGIRPYPHTSVRSTLRGGVWGGGAAAPPQYSCMHACARGEGVALDFGWGVWGGRARPLPPH